MDQQNQGTNSSSPVEPPMKRKRGRPRKDESQVKREKMPKSNSLSETQRHGANPCNDDDDDDEMVGQVVSGVCEGSFDAGYFVTVKVGNTDTLLRGAVFVPGLFTPISAANDVAPYAKMYKRKEIPVPALNPQAQGSSSAPRLRRKNKQPVQPQNTAPMAVDQVPPSDVQCGTPFSIKTNSASTKVPLIYNVPKNDKVISPIEVQLVNQEPVAPEKSSQELQSCSLFAPLDQPASDKVALTDNLPKNETVLSSGGRVQGQISTPVVPQEVFTDQQETGTLFAHKDQGPSLVEPKNDAGISLGEKVQLENQMPIVPDQVLTSQHHIGPSYALENPSITAPLTDYLPKNDTDLALEGEVPIENQVPMSADQVLPILQFAAPLTLSDQLSSVTVHPTYDLLKDDRVLPQGEKVQLEKVLPTAKGQVLLSDLQHGAAFAVENQSTSPVILSAEKLLRKDDGFALEGKDRPQETLELGLGDQPVSVTELKKFHKIIKQDEIFQEMEASTLAKGPKTDVEATKELKLDAESMPYVDVFPGNETVIQVTQVQQQALGPADESKSPNLELHPASVVAEPEYMPFQLISKPVNVLMEKQASPKNDFPQFIQSEFTVKDLLSSSAAFQSNRSPFNDAVNITGGGSLSFPKTSQPTMNFHVDADPVKLKLAAEGSEPPSMFESQLSHPVDPAKDLNSGFKDATIPTKFEINPVAATSNTIAYEDVSQTEDVAQRDET